MMDRKELRAVSFHGDQIVTFEHEGQPYVSMRRIVENMRMDWGSQSVKLKNQSAKFNRCDITTVGLDGTKREMVCIPVEKFPLWLASINPNKVKDPEIRAKVELYQAESAIALHDYWTKGGARKPSSRAQIEGTCAAARSRALPFPRRHDCWRREARAIGPADRDPGCGGGR